MKKAVSKMYRIIKGKMRRIRPFCPRCGRGVFMADHGNFYSCGKCGDRYPRAILKKEKHRMRDISMIKPCTTNNHKLES